MKLANKDLYQLFKDAGLDLKALTLRRKIEIISVYFTWMRLLMTTWQMITYCLNGIILMIQTVQLWMVYGCEVIINY
ncbi:uncharacterized protein [Drosophila takahashii]|uniref:uncharacterized protein n=1 Tax=Drosophila takahashii TaxID=29030 RepID=UPI001CF801A9|nr:uncharacterized protein LOC108061275 [Drosophila takahashii]